MSTTDDTLRVEILGPVRAWRGGTEVQLGPPRQRAAFAVLAMHRDRIVSKAELIRAMWDSDVPATAEGSVYTYLSGLRRSLEPNRTNRAASTSLPSEGSGYRLRLPPEGLDAVTFETLADQARAVLDRGDHRVAANLADQALGLWHGEPLAGLPGSFAAAQRARLSDIRLTLREIRAAAGLANGRHAELVAELTPLVAANPLHEGLRGLLIIALYRSGRQAAALEQFGEARLQFKRELRSRPGAWLTKLHQQVLADDPELGRSAPEGAAAATCSPAAPRELPDRTSATFGRAARADAAPNPLDVLTRGAAEMLRAAALFGGEFRIAEVAVLLGQEHAEVAAAVAEAAAAGVLLIAGESVTFRTSGLRQAVYDGHVPTVRAALHLQAARRLDRAGASIERVAAQLAAIPGPPDSWAIDWVLEHANALQRRAPDVGRDLLAAAVAACDAAEERFTELTAALARVRYRVGETPLDEARAVLATTSDPDLIGEMHWILSYAHYRRGDDAADFLRQAVDTTAMSDLWRARCLALLAKRQRPPYGDPVIAEATALEAIDEAERLGDTFSMALAMTSMWQLRSIGRDHKAALGYADLGLAALAEAGAGHGPALLEHSDIELTLLDNRAFSLQNLDRLAEAGETLRRAENLARRHHLPHGLRVPTAVHRYWTGRWDSALAELADVADGDSDAAFHGLRDLSPLLQLRQGVTALIAINRGDHASAEAALAAADDLTMLTTSARESCDFLLMAEALVAERNGDPATALSVLEPFVAQQFSPMMLRHQWLPDVVRIALAAGQPEAARRAVHLCATEALRETTPARATAALAHCRGLLGQQPDELLRVARRHAKVGRPVERARALEDAAIVFAKTGDERRARETCALAVAGYDALGATALAQRARTQLSAARDSIASNDPRHEELQPQAS